MIHIPDSIFPVDEQGQPLCPKCRNLTASCSCPVLEPTAKAAAGKTSGARLGDCYVRLEKSGRNGKTVTVIRRLPSDEKFLAELARELKVKAGTGGTHYIGEDGGTIELQGDKQQAVREFLRKK